jgi:3-hydroxyacyl-[acyl-carrier-protein] dehydratase
MMDVQQIREYLPHRYPFLLVDRVTELELHNYIVSYKNVSINEPFFNGHFPQFPVMPGVLIVEAMAQTAGVMLGVGMDMIDTDLLIYFMNIDKCKFRRKVIPGDVLEMNVEILRGKAGGKIFKFKGVATVEGEVAAEAEFTAMVDVQKD